MTKIDFEAHFYTMEYLDTLAARKECPRFDWNHDSRIHRLWYAADTGQPFAQHLLDPLLDTGDDRLRRMDAAGIDIQVLSLSSPGLEQLDVSTGTALARKSNDFLAGIIKKHPDRFLGYASLAPRDPLAAVEELERAVLELGFRGWNTHSNYGDTYLDDPRYFPILARAAELGIPIYLHPCVPAMPQLRIYGFAMAGPGLGFGFEVGLGLMRLIFSGVFDRLPNLRIILGHLGEALPFIYQRMDWAYVRPFDPGARPNLAKRPSRYLRENVFITTSGNYYEPAFMCAYQAMGIDRILLATDYPYENSDECMRFIESLAIPAREKEKIYELNGRALLGLK